MYRYLKDASLSLRRHQTPQEKKLWNLLRSRCLDFKFRRQYVIGPYIVDFCCPQKRVIIELDGGMHMKTSQKILDQIRNQYFEKLGYRVLRIWNSEIEYKTNKVVDRINKVLTASGALSPSSRPSPQREKELIR